MSANPTRQSERLFNLARAVSRADGELGHEITNIAIDVNNELEKHITELEAENERLKEAIKHAARILSFGGDVEVMHYLQEALKEQT